AALTKANADQADGKSPYNTGGTGAMVGTGPFMFKEYAVGDHISIVKNPNYYNPAGVAHLDGVTFKPIADQTATLNALQSGDIDLATDINPTDVATVKGDSTLQVIDRGESCNLFHLGMNETHKPFDNLMIRQAVAYAINKQALIDTFYGGQAKVADTWMPLNALDAKAENLPQYDPQKAKDLIAQSGVPASELKIDFHYPSAVHRP